MGEGTGKNGGESVLMGRQAGRQQPKRGSGALGGGRVKPSGPSQDQDAPLASFSRMATPAGLTIAGQAGWREKSDWAWCQGRWGARGETCAQLDRSSPVGKRKGYTCVAPPGAYGGGLRFFSSWAHRTALQGRSVPIAPFGAPGKEGLDLSPNSRAFPDLEAWHRASPPPCWHRDSWHLPCTHPPAGK